ncbi:MAG: acetoin dehydrogenase [Proteobacteria bacterium SG_bin7]|nr:MAG: acetoin dehydrogenase [Proteobacteria bacterium SG_bin7]
MKAAVLTELNQPLKIFDVEVPPLREGEVLVKLAYSGVCHSQLMEARGHRGPDSYLPHLLGHEGTGVVEQIGPGVTKVEPGDKVILGWIRGSGKDARGISYQHGSTKVNAGGVTTFNEKAIVAENRLTLLPHGVPMDVAVLFGCAIPTGAGIVLNKMKPQDNSTIAVFGLGGIGLSALMATQLFKCSKVIGIDVSDEKLELAKSFGATHTINAAKTDVLATIKDLTNNNGVDYSVEASGNARTIELAFSSIRKNGGLCVFASHPANGEKINLDPYDLICGKKIEGTWGGECNPDRDIPLFGDLYRQGKLPLEKLLSHRYKIEDINEALIDLENKRVARPLIEINPSLGV